MKFLKNNVKVIIGFIIGVILAGGIVYAATTNAKDVAYTTNKNGEVQTVADALNDLYNKGKTKTNINVEKIWTSSNKNIDYTYTAEVSGKYIVGIVNCNDEGTKGTVTTESKVLLEKFLGRESAWNATSDIKILEMKDGEQVRINGYNGLYNAGAFIYRLDNINITSIDSSELLQDKQSNLTYTATEDNENVIALGISFGTDRKNDIKYEGFHYSKEIKDESFCIGCVILNKNASVNISSYGYNYGGGMTIILK